MSTFDFGRNMLKHSVVIITLNRPDCVQECLDHLAVQSRIPEQVIVVDSSPDERTTLVCNKFEKTFDQFLYMRNETGIGRMTTSRNLALPHCSGEIISFVDDDAYAHPDWAVAVLTTLNDESISAVAGHVVGDMSDPDLPIGVIDSNGNVIGNFGKLVDGPTEVEHAMGCNMSFRASVLTELAGFRTDYPGISGIREDTDVFLRLKSLGRKIVFQPTASVRHIGAPQMKGRRFDLTYTYSSARNHTVLLIRNREYLRSKVGRHFLNKPMMIVSTLVRRIVSAFAYAVAEGAGIAVGLVQAVVKQRH
jgi:glycosyltransferase involved in cell wall biosynthesis